ncbi:MAG: nuclear transport factor 2 family protein [Sphingorhabdus sp.]|nr:nuclear transport factor 2 family protein [Sphingorhabdus sp.]
MAVRSVQEKLQELLDKEEIFALSSTYMRGLDRLEPDLVRSVYHDDATDDRGFFQGGPDAFVDFAMQALAGHKANHHMLGQASIDVEGDVAFGEIYFQAYHRTIEDGAEMDFVVIGRYVDRYEKRDGCWKIAHRSELNDACWSHPASDDWFQSTPNALRGARGADDLSSKKEVLRTL